MSRCCRCSCRDCCCTDFRTMPEYCLTNSSSVLIGRVSIWSMGTSNIGWSVIRIWSFSWYRARIREDMRARISESCWLLCRIVFQLYHRWIIDVKISLMILQMSEDPFLLGWHWFWYAAHELLRIPENRLCQPSSVCESTTGSVHGWIEDGSCWLRNFTILLRNPDSIHCPACCLSNSLSSG